MTRVIRHFEVTNKDTATEYVFPDPEPLAGTESVPLWRRGAPARREA